ncbi:hypothetical protein QTP70_011983 [Hemibagrus guttatus]|uniref:Tc1-like transposase DDE domain-containing protein n=1 Tax=Hemibagrus guttatus TaxID=175788 RepID=A0AAE0QGD1_9TELE|nr:hypothetical protein QTP70_011983 [Hemibagrus guttatus]KAK3552366.1 hypothetical protein QTP86_011281 [Hemibagrus guttatus]
MVVVVNPGLDRSGPIYSLVHKNIKLLYKDNINYKDSLDNAPCHKAKMVQEWFDEHNKFEVLTWPPNSPDLNPIEHLWDFLDKQFRSMEDPSHNLEDLEDLLLTSWCQIPQHTFRDLVESMPGQGCFGSKTGNRQYYVGGHNVMSDECM